MFDRHISKKYCTSRAPVGDVRPLLGKLMSVHLTHNQQSKVRGAFIEYVVIYIHKNQK